MDDTNLKSNYWIIVISQVCLVLKFLRCPCEREKIPENQYFNNSHIWQVCLGWRIVEMRRSIASVRRLTSRLTTAKSIALKFHASIWHSFTFTCITTLTYCTLITIWACSRTCFSQNINLEINFPLYFTIFEADPYEAVLSPILATCYLFL